MSWIVGALVLALVSLSHCPGRAATQLPTVNPDPAKEHAEGITADQAAGKGQGEGGKLIAILPLGDALTEGEGGYDSYRRPLWYELKRIGVAFDYIGTQKGNHNQDRSPHDYDLDHEGHWDWDTKQLLDQLDGMLGGKPIDVVLLLIGSNDIVNKLPLVQSMANIEAVLDIIYHHNPKAVVLLGQIPAMADPDKNRLVEQFNQELEGRFGDYRPLPGRLILVDLFTGFVPQVDTIDGLHPNNQGSRKLADGWFLALRKIFAQL